MATTDYRTSPADVRYDVADVRAFIREALIDDEPAIACAR